MPLPDYPLRALRVSIITPAPTTTVVLVAGELDLATAPLLDAHLAEAARASGLLVVDLTEVSFMGVAGITVLTRHRARADRFKVVAADRPVLRLFHLLDLVVAFDIHPTLADALSQDARRC